MPCTALHCICTAVLCKCLTLHCSGHTSYQHWRGLLVLPRKKPMKRMFCWPKVDYLLTVREARFVVEMQILPRQRTYPRVIGKVEWLVTKCHLLALIQFLPVQGIQSSWCVVPLHFKCSYVVISSFARCLQFWISVAGIDFVFSLHPSWIMVVGPAH